MSGVQDNGRTRRRRRWPWLVALMVLAVGVAGGAGLVASVNQAGVGDPGLVHTVERGALTISVSESGTIKSRNSVTIRSEVEGRTTILSLIPEGTMVEEGDVLVELDASDLEERKLDQEISVENAQANWEQASETLAVTENRAEANVAQAELDLRFATEDLEHYKEVEYPMELQRAKNRVTLAEEEYQQAVDRWEGSQRLHKARYISDADLARDRLARDRADIDRQLAEREQENLENHTRQRRIAELESAAHQAKLALERIKREASADVLQATATERARRAELERQRSRLARLERQIENATIRAPTAGMVVYSEQGSRWNPEPLVEGLEVRERQELMTLPTANTMDVDLRIHESQRHKVAVGQRARIRVDAVPDEVFMGTITRIGVMAEDGGRWNPELREYAAQVEIDGEHESLSPGMSATVDVRVAHYDDTLSVPVQSVMRVAGRPTVYVVDGRGQLERRAVELGLDNNRMVRILGGLEPGERVALAPPLDEGEREEFGPDPDDTDIRHADAGDDVAITPVTDGDTAEQQPAIDAELAQLLQGLRRVSELGVLDRLDLSESVRSEVDTALERLDQNQTPELSDDAQRTLRTRMAQLQRQFQQRGGSGAARGAQRE